jgi:hypothetical protein
MDVGSFACGVPLAKDAVEDGVWFRMLVAVDEMDRGGRDPVDVGEPGWGVEVIVGEVGV